MEWLTLIAKITAVVCGVILFYLLFLTILVNAESKPRLNNICSDAKLDRDSGIGNIISELKIQKYYPGQMGIPQAIIGGVPEIIPMANTKQWVKCDYCGQLTDISEGCCSHCGGRITFKESGNVKWLASRERFSKYRDEVARQRTMIRLDQNNCPVFSAQDCDESILPEPSGLSVRYL